jgi:hypothetical protein
MAGLRKIIAEFDLNYIYWPLRSTMHRLLPLECTLRCIHVMIDISNWLGGLLSLDFEQDADVKAATDIAGSTLSYLPLQPTTPQ